ncbi:MAG TPA: hypothetical protein PKW15_05940 [Alphaproteobacteria bacterium]|nr:hypothetical protein [Alphaproteobacteria bacterium]
MSHKLSRRNFLKLAATASALTTLLCGTAFAGNSSGESPLLSQNNDKTIGRMIGTQTYITANQKDPEEFRKTAAAMAGIGMSSMRMDVLWWDTRNIDKETQVSTVNAEGDAAFLERIRICAGLNMSPILVFPPVHTSLPETQFGWEWMGWPTTEKNKQAYAEWVADEVAAINQALPNLKITVQLGNEVSKNNEWKKYADDYADLVKLTSELLKDRGLKNYTLALGSVDLAQGDVNAADLMKYYRQNRVLDSVDLVTLQFYGRDANNEFAPEGVLGILDATLAELKGKAFSVTEVGQDRFTHSMATDKPDPEAMATKERLQSAHVVRAVLIALCKGAKHVTIYEARDRHLNGEEYHEKPGAASFLGMIKQDRNLTMLGQTIAKFVKDNGELQPLPSFEQMHDNPRHYQVTLLNRCHPLSKCTTIHAITR